MRESLMLDRAEGERKSLSFGTPSRNHIMENDDLSDNIYLVQNIIPWYVWQIFQERRQA